MHLKCREKMGDAFLKMGDRMGDQDYLEMASKY